MGSVKDLEKTGLAGKLWVPPEPHRFGQGGWRVSGRFSVRDLKKLISPIEIDLKNFGLAMTAGAYWEHAANHGIESCYLGMMDKYGNIVDTTTLLDRGELSDVIVMKLANTPQEKTEEGIRAYHKAIRDGDISVYVADAESIFRAGLPLGSSAFEKIFELTGGIGGDYSRLATYDEVVAGLDKIRTAVELRGLDNFPGLTKYLNKLGLSEIPNPGALLPKPVLNFTTKFALSGDEDITEEQAMERMGLGQEGYDAWRLIVTKCAENQIAYCKGKGITNIDGKVEGAVAGGNPLLTDFACTVDENRLMLPFSQGGISYLVPTNKEIQRAVFKAEGIDPIIDQAKKEYGSQWQDHFYDFVSKEKVDDVTNRSCAMMADAIKLMSNMAFGRDVFDARPLTDWVDPFLPYASRVQPAPTYR